MSGKFLKIRCPRCRHTQMIFGKASTRVKCLVCNMQLIKPQGGKARVRAEIKQIVQ